MNATIGEPMGNAPAAPTPTDSAPADRTWDRMILFVAIGVVLAAFSLDVVSNDRIALHGLQEYPLPHLCPSRAWFGFQCPGCGLTRSAIHLAHGQWQESLAAHRLGWLVLAMIVGQIPRRTWRLIDPTAASRSASRWETWLWVGLAALLVVNWLAELVERA